MAANLLCDSCVHQFLINENKVNIKAVISPRIASARTSLATIAGISIEPS